MTGTININFGARIGYTFQSPALLEMALTHSSHANEHRRSSQGSYERLEFLGDAVLGMLTAEYLYQAHPTMPEGELTKLRSQLICEPSLCAVAKSLELGKVIRLGKGELSAGGQTRPSVLADVVEALLAAIYLDGGVVAARDFYQQHICDIVVKASAFNDYKTQLQEIVQRQQGRKIAYSLDSETGPEHAKTFTASVAIDDIKRGTGNGHSRKEAEQKAAEMAMGDKTWY
ncbi:MAG: ribonuclease III [Oscillospiraceae bacterium]|nr:ribonuclease III [Oscillospiraceae bacterium]